MNKTRYVLALLCALALTMAACGDTADSANDDGNNAANNDDGNNDVNNDGNNDGNNDVNNDENNDVNNDGNNDVNNDGGGACDRNDFTPTRQGVSSSDGFLRFSAASSDDTPFDTIEIQIYASFNGPTEAGTYSLDGINYRDCGLCVLANADCDGQSCQKTFYAEQGTVEIDNLGVNLGETFSGRLVDAVFDEVNIDFEGDFTSTPVPGGETWCINDLSFAGEIRDPNAARCEDPNVNCVGEEVPDFELQNCATGEMESISQIAGEDKALWFVLTAGWCPACRQWLPQVVERQDTEGLKVAYILGEDASYNQPTLEYCQRYAASYTDAERFYIDHNGEFAFATMFTAMWPYVDANGAFGLPWNAVVDGETFEYLYADGAMGDLNATLNDALTEE